MGQGGFLFSMCSHSGRSPPMVASSTKKCRSGRSRSDHQWVDHCGHEHHQDPLHAGGRTPLGTYFSWFRPLVFILFDQYRWCDHLSFLFTSILLSFICHSVTRTNSFHLFFIPRSFRTSPAFLSHDLFFLLHSFASFLFFHLHNIYRIATHKKDSVWESFEAVFFCEQQQSYLHRCRQWILLVVYFDRSLLRTN